MKTTDISNIDKYVEEAQALAMRTIGSSKPLEKMSDEEYLDKINSLNPEQRRIFDEGIVMKIGTSGPLARICKWCTLHYAN